MSWFRRTAESDPNPPPGPLPARGPLTRKRRRHDTGNWGVLDTQLLCCRYPETVKDDQPYARAGRPSDTGEKKAARGNWWRQVRAALMKTANEYWIDDDGNTMYADGDVGEYNHEAHVVQTILCQHDLDPETTDLNDPQDHLKAAQRFVADEPLEAAGALERAGVMGELVNSGALPPDWRAVLDGTASAPQHQQLELFPHPDTTLPDDDRYDRVRAALMSCAAEVPVDALYRWCGLSDAEVAAVTGATDAREFATVSWGWKRVVGDNIQTHTLTPKDLQVIADGVREIGGGDWGDGDSGATEERTWNIDVQAARTFYTDVPESLLGGSPTALRPYARKY